MPAASTRIWRTLNDGRRLGFALVILAMVKKCQEELPAAQEHAEEALRTFRALEDNWGEALAGNDLGNVMLAQGDVAAARGLFEASIGLGRVGRAPGPGSVREPPGGRGDHGG